MEIKIVALTLIALIKFSNGAEDCRKKIKLTVDEEGDFLKTIFLLGNVNKIVQLPDSHKYKCYLNCIHEKHGFMKDGEIIGRIKSKITKSPDKCETAYKFSMLFRPLFSQKMAELLQKKPDVIKECFKYIISPSNNTSTNVIETKEDNYCYLNCLYKEMSVMKDGKIIDELDVIDPAFDAKICKKKQ